MKIKVEGQKIVKAVNKLHGVEVVLENLEDAREALQLIFTKLGLFEREESGRLADLKVSSYQRYETSAVEYKSIFLLEFVFEEKVSPEARVEFIKELQEFFARV